MVKATTLPFSRYIFLFKAENHQVSQETPAGGHTITASLGTINTRIYALNTPCRPRVRRSGFFIMIGWFGKLPIYYGKVKEKMS